MSSRKSENTNSPRLRGVFPNFCPIFLIFTLASILSCNFYSRPTFLLRILFGHFANSATSRSFFYWYGCCSFCRSGNFKRGGIYL